jgi:hypothetical protein
MNGQGSVSNSQCTVTGAGTSAAGSGSILTRLRASAIFWKKKVGCRRQLTRGRLWR